MRNPLRVRFVRHVAMTGGAQASQAAFAMISGIIVARVLGASAKGTISVLTALGVTTVLVSSLGVHLSAVYFLGRFKSERDSIVSNSILIGVLGGMAAAGALLAVGILFRGPLLHGIDLGLFALFVLSVPFYYFNEFGRALLLGAGRVGTYNLPDVVGGAVLFTGTAAALVVLGEHIAPLVALRVVLEIAVTLMIIYFLRKYVRFRFQPSRKLLRRQLNFGLRNYTASLLWLCLLQSDVLLCNHFLGARATGIYSVAVSLGLPITMLAGVIGTLTFQRVSAENSRETRIAQTNRTLRVLLPIVTLSVTGLGLLSHLIVPLVYGHQFDPAANALILLLPGLVAFSLEVVLMNFLAGDGSPSIVAWAPAVGLVVNVVANLFVIPRWGINGASATSSAAYGLVFLLVLRYYRRVSGSTLRDVLGTTKDDIRALLDLRRAREPEAQTA
jgi:O-antigen/teichoic acid export membrane protein